MSISVPKVSAVSFGMTVPLNVKNNKENEKSLSFGYNNQLKTLFLRGKLPSVQYDISGRKLTKKNVTLDHVIPKSKGGPSNMSNYTLATYEFNQLKGNKPMKDFLTIENLTRYIKQFLDVHVDNFWGNKYIKDLLETLKRADEMGV